MQSGSRQRNRPPISRPGAAGTLAGCWPWRRAPHGLPAPPACTACLHGPDSPPLGKERVSTHAPRCANEFGQQQQQQQTGWLSESRPGRANRNAIRKSYRHLRLPGQDATSPSTPKSSSTASRSVLPHLKHKTHTHSVSVRRSLFDAPTGTARPHLITLTPPPLRLFPGRVERAKSPRAQTFSVARKMFRIAHFTWPPRQRGRGRAAVRANRHAVHTGRYAAPSSF